MRERSDKIVKSWPELAEADKAANGGLGLELLSAEGYAERDGVSTEAYIVAVLRAERIRRQDQDALVSDRALLDELLGEARAAGMSVIDYTAQRYGNGRGPEGLSADFLRKLVRRLEETGRPAP